MRFLLRNLKANNKFLFLVKKAECFPASLICSGHHTWSHGSERVNNQNIYFYRTAVTPTIDLLCREDLNDGLSEAESSTENFLAQ